MNGLSRVIRGCLLAALACLVVLPAFGQADVAPAEDELSRRARKEAAKQQRIDEYLKKREERRVEREQQEQAQQAQQAEEQARQIEAEQLAAEREKQALESEALGAAPAAAAAGALSAPVAAKPPAKPGKLPRGLARAQANIRATELALDPTVQEYLNLIDAQGASAHQLAAFGNFVAQNGMVRDAMEYYAVALRLAENDDLLWVNLGTLHLQTKDLSGAVNAFSRALALNPNNAVAHYNLGAALDEMNRYEEAIQAYKTALTLDPTLGDPAENPQAANNPRLLAVKLMMYQEQSGSLSHPLIDVTIRDASPRATGER